MLQGGDASQQGGGGNFSFIIMMVLIFVVMYFFMIRPQQKRQKELNKFRNSLENGMAIFRAQTGVDLGVNDTPVSDEGLQYDFLETDYH